MADRPAPPSSSDHQILLFPFMAQGHIIPFLSLAGVLERSTPFSVTLVSTPFNIHKLRATLPATSSIRLLPLPYSPADHGLPPGADNTDGLPYSLLLPLFISPVSSPTPLHRTRPIAAGSTTAGLHPLATSLPTFVIVTSPSSIFFLLLTGSPSPALALFWSLSAGARASSSLSPPASSLPDQALPLFSFLSFLYPQVPPFCLIGHQ